MGESGMRYLIFLLLISNLLFGDRGLKIVLKDRSFIDDSDKINFEQTLKELSPETDVWVV